MDCWPAARVLRSSISHRASASPSRGSSPPRRSRSLPNVARSARWRKPIARYPRRISGRLQSFFARNKTDRAKRYRHLWCEAVGWLAGARGLAARVICPSYRFMFLACHSTESLIGRSWSISLQYIAAIWALHRKLLREHRASHHLERHPIERGDSTYAWRTVRPIVAGQTLMQR